MKSVIVHTITRGLLLSGCFLFLLIPGAFGQNTPQPAPGLLVGSVPYESNSSQPGAVSILISQAMEHIQHNAVEMALTELDQAYDLAIDSDDPELLKEVIGSMATVYYETGDYEQARRFYEQLLELDVGNKSFLGVAYYNLGHVSASEGDFNKAEEQFKQSLIISKELADQEGEAYALKALGVNAQAQLIPDLAKTYLIHALQIFTQLKDEIQIANLNRHLGDIALLDHDYKLANEHYLHALPIYLNNSIEGGLMRTYRGLSQVYENLNEFDKALITYKAFNAILQDQLEQENRENTQRLQVQFETQRYAAENNDLEQVNLTQQVELDYRESLLQKQYVIILLTIALICLAVLLFYRSQQFGKKMKALATIDGLTGLLNRRAIMDYGCKELQRAERFKRSFSCLMFDIDHFKSINDNFGHDIGDCVLKTVSEVVKSKLRQTDALGRIGGEEFLLLSAETDQKNAWMLAERIREEIAATRYEEMPGREVTVSIGITEMEGDQTLDVLVKQADLALYDAKNKGRNRAVVFQP